MELYLTYLICVIVILSLFYLGITRAYKIDHLELEDDEVRNEFENLYTEIDIIFRDEDIKGLNEGKHALAKLMLTYGTKMYKEGFHAGQEFNLQEGLPTPEHEAKIITKTQERSPI